MTSNTILLSAIGDTITCLREIDMQNEEISAICKNAEEKTDGEFTASEVKKIASLRYKKMIKEETYKKEKDKTEKVYEVVESL